MDVANLFPETDDMIWTDTDVTNPDVLEDNRAVFGRSWRFDFEAGSL